MVGGATAAGATMGPWGALAGMAVDVVGGAMSNPGMATGSQSNKFDTSGWNVNFGNGNIDSARSESQAGSLDAYMPYAVLFVGVMLVWRLTRKK